MNALNTAQTIQIIQSPIARRNQRGQNHSFLMSNDYNKFGEVGGSHKWRNVEFEELLIGEIQIQELEQGRKNNSRWTLKNIIIPPKEGSYNSLSSLRTLGPTEEEKKLSKGLNIMYVR